MTENTNEPIVEGEGFIMMAPTSAKDRVFAAVMRRVNVLIQEMLTPDIDDAAAVEAAVSFRRYLFDHDLQPRDLQFRKKESVEPDASTEEPSV